jgi:hypothetical protein
MKCQACDQPATLHVTEIVAGEAVDFHVCEAHFDKLDSLPKDAARKRPYTDISGFVSEPELRAVLSDPVVRGKMAAHLLPALCLALLDEQPEVRIAAAYRLLKLGSDAKSASGALRDALRDPDERVRKAADITLKSIESGQEPPWFV